MKVQLAFVAILWLVSSALSFTCNDGYVASDGSSYYLADIAWENDHWMNVTDAAGNEWFFHISTCNVLVSNASPCPSESSVCVSVDGGAYVNRGTTSSVLLSDSPYGADEGVEMVYGSDDLCSTSKSSIKTAIELVCSGDSVPVVSIQTSEDCFTVITVNTSMACPSAYLDSLEYSSEYIHTYPLEVHSYRVSFGALLFMGTIFTCLAMCCCCFIRKRRCQQRKDIAMKQFSNVAFQPIPATTQIKTTTSSTGAPQQQPLPSYNPYLQQQQPQQFVYYYPSQSQSQNQVPLQTFQPVVSVPDINKQHASSDEKFARDLQAQFDRESNV